MTAAERFDRLTDPRGVADNMKQRSVRAGAFAMGAEGVDFFLRIGSIVILARLLVPEHFGLISMVTAFTSIADRFKDLGLGLATIQRKEITHEQVSNLFWVNLAVGVAVMLAVAGCAVPLSLLYHDPRLIPITLAVAMSFPWDAATIQHQALLRRQMKYRQIAGIKLSASVLSIAFGVMVAVNGGGYWALVVREVSRNILEAVGSWFCMPWIPGLFSRRTPIRSMLWFGRDLTVFNLVYYVASSLDQMIVGKLFGAISLGFYRQGFQLALTPFNQVIVPVNSVSESALSRLQGDPEKYRRYYAKILSVLSLGTMPLAVFLAVFAEEIVRFVLGAKWIGASNIFRIMAIAGFIKPALATTGFVMVTTGHSRRYLWLGVTCSASLVLFFAIGSFWGAEGVAFGHAANSYLSLIPYLYWSFKGTPVSTGLFFRVISRPLVASLLTGAALYVLKSAHLVSGAPQTIALGMAAAAPLYLGLICLFPGGLAELRQLMSDFGPALNPTQLWTARAREAQAEAR